MTVKGVAGWLGHLMIPRRADYAGLRTSWRRDLLAGLTVGIVALPLALGFGVASGVGAGAGLVTAIVAGAVAAVFGGSHLQVSGPTGAMTVVLVPVVARFGVDAVGLIAVLAGVIIVIMGVLGMGRLVSLIPWPVVEGFTIGIGIVIALQQVPLALDLPKPDGENSLLVAIDAVRVVDWAAAAQPLALVALVIAIMVVTTRLRRSLPASLIAVAAATVASLVFSMDVDRIGALPSIFATPSLPAVELADLRTLLSAALAVAALGALESLLSARVADGMADDIGRTQGSRELVGQGLANVASGLLGGMPATGAIARTAVAVRAGARTRVSALTHAVLLAVVVLVAAPLVAHIPLSALAGVLIVTAARMVNIRTARSILRSTRRDGAALLVTVLVTVAFDLILAVEVGVAVAAVLALRSVSKVSGLRREELPAEIGAEQEHELLHEHIAVYRFDGALFFGVTRRFLEELAAAVDVRVIILRLSSVRLMDASGANALAEFIVDKQAHGVTVLLKGIPADQRRLLESVGVFDTLRTRKHVFTTMPEAIEHARSHVRRELGGEPPILPLGRRSH
ncbi:SulP family inorganic anion transporter [Occultella aeris]|uniref:C4-dicarboxylic acid transporter DauA n=1 Tax=Occultella aeris TaxID=2761496 RepID=A0A7M4DPS1_9MICO|nr:SulP family inorganic anion transporter [Occultella aeris]VZO39465.1 C4-dicarboxylic acid transporter DauA [Occultella aeris]